MPEELELEDIVPEEDVEEEEVCGELRWEDGEGCDWGDVCWL